MCQGFNWLISFGSFFGLIQSVTWMAFGIVGALTYLCVIPVAPYKDESDFFRVTLVKLYFEGPNCIPDGSYLGEFNEKYKKLPLFKPELVFATMIAYVILNAFYFMFSLRLHTNRNNPDKRVLTLSWSALTLVQCAVDLVLTYIFILDVFTLQHKRMDEAEQIVSSAKRTSGEFPYISMVLALVSVRFIAIWLWNFIVGFVLFFDALWFRNIIGTPPKPEKKIEEVKPEKVIEEPEKPKEETPNCVSVLNGKYTSAFDIRSNPDYFDLKKSMEAVTRFSNVPDKATSHRRTNNKNWDYIASDEAYWNSSKPETSRDWEMTNEGYVSDEPVEPERNFDFDHNLKNFESGQRKIKVVKPPIGKPVSIPNPPPLPTSGSCNC